MAGHKHHGNLRPLPPFGRSFVEYTGGSGPFVAMGPGAWGLARRRWRCYPVMVLPDDRDPLDMHWPVADRPVVLIEVGCFDTERLKRLAFALLRDRATHVTPIRVAQLAAVRPAAWPIFYRDDVYDAKFA